MRYLHARRRELGGYLPVRPRTAPAIRVPALGEFSRVLEGSKGREESTTMVFVRLLSQLLRDPNLGKRVVPIVADEARTFGMQSLFRQVAIYSSVGQLYDPEDRDELLYYKEAKDGQILEEGITEAGAMSSWMAAATSYSTHGVAMLPFYIFYSMFGFQRVGDFIWAAADSRARGFLIGATSGRTTLSGEGLQHEDGSSHVIAATVPNCISYDPAFGHELAVIVQDGVRRMFEAQEDVFYYITVTNENYSQPAMPAGCEEGILRGMYLVREARGERREERGEAKVQLMGSGTILREALAAAEILERDFAVGADVWSVTSFTELARDGMQVERWNRLHPEAPPRVTWIESCLKHHSGPAVAATDYVRAYAEQIRAFVTRPYTVLGTDGFGRSDTRTALRAFFEVDRNHIAIAALKALADQEALPTSTVSAAIAKLGIDPARTEPWHA
jgi:pyruvate dehydrogenase E1 component